MEFSLAIQILDPASYSVNLFLKVSPPLDVAVEQRRVGILCARSCGKTRTRIQQRHPLTTVLPSLIFYSKGTKEMSPWEFTREESMEKRRPDKLPVTSSSRVVTLFLGGAPLA